ncbi:hypothetical protein FXF02_04500 [Vibrio cholerae]|nr:hypothetical protein FXF02_04500 [Vibrio cholerae]
MQSVGYTLSNPWPNTNQFLKISVVKQDEMEKTYSNSHSFGGSMTKPHIQPSRHINCLNVSSPPK